MNLVTEAAAQPAPPVARKAPHKLEAHGKVRTDEYYWLRERENPEVIAYLEAENAYTDAVMAHTKALQDKLFEEMVGRIKQDDASVPFRKDGYWYYTRYEAGKDYPIYARKKGTLEASEELLIDANAEAEGHGYFAISAFEPSPDHQTLAFAADTVGRRIYTIRFKDLRTGRMLDDEIPAATPNLVWANDNRTVFYTRQDPQTLRPDRIFRHTLGTDPERDVLVYEEKDETFGTSISKSRSEEYLFIESDQTLATEVRYLRADDPNGTFRVVEPRRRDHEYHVEHYGDAFYIRTNDGAPNFRLMRTPIASTGRSHWQEVVPHRADVLLEGFDPFKDYLVLTERRSGLVELRVRPWKGEGEHYVRFDEPAYLAYLGVNAEFDTRVLRFHYTSLATPTTVYDYNMATRERTLLKRDEVLGGFDASKYVTERVMATAGDGTPIPISLVYRRDMKRPGGNPTLLYGYGSYGISMDATFNSARLSLLDRGFVYAIAHIRGGQEMGRAWYENGKLLKKKNTFTDFIDAGAYLVKAGYAGKDKLYAMGGSAGGLLMGAVVNLRPDLFKGVIAAVPFVDVVTTMLDETIPLTTSEYDEWGNPNDPVYYDYMLSYSPYDNVERKAYPNMLVMTGLHDSQVQYWEPAKWVARLRAMKTDQNRLLLQTNMEAGHGGASGRFRRLHETALQYAFLLDLEGGRG